MEPWKISKEDHRRTIISDEDVVLISTLKNKIRNMPELATYYVHARHINPDATLDELDDFVESCDVGVPVQSRLLVRQLEAKVRVAHKRYVMIIRDALNKGEWVPKENLLSVIKKEFI